MKTCNRFRYAILLISGSTGWIKSRMNIYALLTLFADLLGYFNKILHELIMMIENGANLTKTEILK
jgi:hypothetical protein